MGLYIAYSISYAVVVLAYHIVLGMFFERPRVSTRVLLLTYFPMWVASSTFVFIPMWVASSTPHIARLLIVLTSVIQISLLYVATLGYESSVVKRLAAVGCFYLMDGLVRAGYVLLMTAFPENPLFSPDLSVTTIAVMTFLFLAVAVLLRVLAGFAKVEKNAVDIPAIWLPAVILSLFMLLIGYMEIFDVPFAYETWMTFLWLGLVFLPFYLRKILTRAYKDRIDLALHTQEKEYYFEQCRLMRDSVDKMKAYRHDIKLHLTAVQDFIEKNKPGEADEYISNLIGSVDRNEIYSDTGNIAFDSIVNFKLNNAAERNITLDVNVVIPPELPVEVSDIVTIMGNLLDNALEAVEKTEEKLIRLSAEIVKGNLHIKVANTFDGKVVYAEGTSIATRKSGDRHGYGLQNVRRCVEKYDGHMDISHDDSIFSVGILLYTDR